jgi:hypothetical protein
MITTPIGAFDIPDKFPAMELTTVATATSCLCY